jgi:hypothetical protein
VRGEEPLAPDELLNGFDFTNVALAVTPVFLDEPIRTESGKIRLLVQ